MKTGKTLWTCLRIWMAAALITLTGMAMQLQAASPADTQPLKIGIIGTGNIGSALAAHWAKAGHELLISSRHPDELTELAKSLGPNVRIGTPREAAAYGDVILLAVPYSATPQIGSDYAKEIKGKILLDTGNPYPQRDGAMAIEARRKGTGVSSAEFLPGVKLVRAFNAINAGSLRTEANHAGGRYAIPLAGNDAQALAVAQRLVEDAGFEPVVVGDLSRAREFDFGTGPYTKLQSAADLRKELGLPAPTAK